MHCTWRPRLIRYSASHVATTDLPTPPFPFSTRWMSADVLTPFTSEFCFAMRVPLYIREWERQESDSQTNFFFEGSPSHIASRTLYRGLLSALMAFANGFSVTVGVGGAVVADRGDCRL